MNPLAAARKLLEVANIDSPAVCKAACAGCAEAGYHAVTGGYVAGERLRPMQIGVELLGGVMPLYWIFDYEEVAHG